MSGTDWFQPLSDEEKLKDAKMLARNYECECRAVAVFRSIFRVHSALPKNFFHPLLIKIDIQSPTPHYPQGFDIIHIVFQKLPVTSAINKRNKFFTLKPQKWPKRMKYTFFTKYFWPVMSPVFQIQTACHKRHWLHSYATGCLPTSFSS